MNPAGSTPPLLNEAPAPRPRRRWLKWTAITVGALFALLLLAVGLVAVSLNGIVRKAAIKRLEEATGMTTELASVQLHLLPPGVELKGLRMMNTPEFGGSPFIDLPELALSVDRSGTKDGKFKLHEFRLDLATVNVVINERGERNVDVLRHRAEEAQAKQSGTSRTKTEKPKMELGGIDRLDLSIGTMKYTDLRPPVVSRTVKFNWTNQVMTNIVSKDDLNARLLLLTLSQRVTVDGERDNGFGVLDMLGLLFGPK